jgi:tetrahydromethanopterin S-methyltransferase subunit C
MIGSMIMRSETRGAPAQDLLARVPTAPLAAAGLIGGFGVAVATGSRPLGGVVLAAFGLSCIAVSSRRDSRRVTAALTATGLLAFGASHPLGHAIGAWPAVLSVSVLTAALCWRLSDSRRPPRPAGGLAGR